MSNVWRDCWTIEFITFVLDVSRSRRSIPWQRFSLAYPLSNCCLVNRSCDKILRLYKQIPVDAFFPHCLSAYSSCLLRSDCDSCVTLYVSLSRAAANLSAASQFLINANLLWHRELPRNLMQCKRCQEDWVKSKQTHFMQSRLSSPPTKDSRIHRFQLVPNRVINECCALRKSTPIVLLPHNAAHFTIVENIVNPGGNGNFSYFCNYGWTAATFLRSTV